MTALTWVLLAFAVIGLLFGLWQWTARRRTVQRLDNMLEQSISSGFTEEHFDEQNCLPWRQNLLGSCAALLIRKKR